MERKTTKNKKLTCAETIKEITRQHLKNGGVALGECLSAVGWVGGTVPELTEDDGLIELSMADVAGGGIVVGLALAGRRPIYIVRYQGFQWFNAPMIVNYAAKSKDLWNIPCPVFVRSIAMEGGIGPVASNSHHGIFNRMPGVFICAPMTPKEYQMAWNHFIDRDDPMYVSEHRRSFGINYEISDKIIENSDITIMAISATRLNALEAIKTLDKDGVQCNLINLFWLKPVKNLNKLIEAVDNSKYGGLIIDGDYANGMAKTIAYDVMLRSRKKVNVLALEERTAGFAPYLDNLPPSSEKICTYVKDILK